MKPIDPDNCCPICGARLHPTGLDDKVKATRYAAHRCQQKVLSGIDGAHRRSPDEEEPRRRSLASRWKMAEEFRLMTSDGIDAPLDDLE